MTIHIAALFTIAVCSPQLAPNKPSKPAVAPGATQNQKRPDRLADLAWLAGTWASEASPDQADKNRRSSEEHWSSPRNGLMLGTHRDLHGERVFFEYLRIVQRGKKLIYIASPSGRGATEFALEKLEGQRVVFANAKHDWPKRIVYERKGDTLRAIAEGKSTRGMRRLEWSWKLQQASALRGARSVRQRSVRPRSVRQRSVRQRSVRPQSVPQRGGAATQARGIDESSIRSAARLIGLDFDAKEIDLMLPGVRRRLASFARMRRGKLGNEIYPALSFSPFLPGIADRSVRYERKPLALPNAERPSELESLAFADIPTLAALIKSRKVSCVELTKLFLARLERLDKKLACVITFTKERALEQAKRLDAELAAGKWRGPLHGIPYGAKDLFAAKGYPTTWGAKPYKDQVIDLDASVITKLEKAGAVLIAKLTLGALAWGDVWFGGKTKNPWNLERGSSGSSAGSASATAAGAVVFALGTETLGSIVSPSRECGCSSLRPTFGLVSRHGAMALSWTMDKVGPICRSALDAAIVFDAIRGSDGKDATVIDRPFAIPQNASVKGMKVGVLRGRWQNSDEFAPFFEDLKALGVELVEISLPRFPVNDLTFVLQVEGAAAFDELTRSGRDAELVRQIRNAWPNVFRSSRLIPAVEYIQANRIRTQLMRAYDKALAKCDVLVHPPYTGGILAASNLTGHPTFCAPYGQRRDGAPSCVCFTGQLADESRLLALVTAWQRRTKHHHRHPKLD